MSSSCLVRLLRLAQPLSLQMALATLLGVLTISASIGLMSTSAYLICQAGIHPSVAALSVAIVGVRFFGLARGVFRYLERYVSHQVTFKLLVQIRVWLFRQIEPLAPAGLLNGKYQSGDLLGRMVADIETLQDFYVRVIAPPAVALVVGMGLTMFLATFSGSVAVIFLLFYSLSGVGLPWLTYRLGRQTNQQLIAVRTTLNIRLVDSLQGMADLLAFGQAEAQAAEIARLNRKLAQLQNRQSWLTGWQLGAGNFLMHLAAVAVLVVAIPQVASGQLNGLYLATLVLATLAGFEAVLPLPTAFQHLGSSLAAAQRLFELADQQAAIQFAAANDQLTPDNLRVRFEQVSFRYSPTEPLVIENLSFELPHGQTLALVGPSGSGKSTVASLLLRFYDPVAGQIWLGEQPLSTYSQDQLYSQIAVVTQDTHLFNTTIRQNIALAWPGATQEQIEQVARQAQLHDFIVGLPEGYDTLIGEQGFRLSGGERQRLAIARALLQNAPLLILDEPTANLDPQTEHDLVEALRTVQQHRTTLLITHNPAVLALADRIYRL